MTMIVMIVQIMLGVFFTPEGVVKWTHIGPSTARFVHFRYPRWFKYFTGVWEVLVGIGFLVGLWVPLLAALAAVLLSVEMLVAIYSHLVRSKDALSELLPAVVFFLLAGAVLIVHRESLGRVFPRDAQQVFTSAIISMSVSLFPSSSDIHSSLDLSD